MKEELQSKLVEILTSIQTAAGKASDFAMAELPDVARSYVMYGRVVETAEFLIPFVAALVIGYFYLTRILFNSTWLRTDDRAPGEWTDARFFAFLGSSAVLVVFLAVAASNFAQFAMVWFAPKVWLLKEIASLIR
jgi:hypothetical protein